MSASLHYSDTSQQKRFLFQRFKKSVGFACGSGVKETSSGPERNLQA